MIKNDIRIGSNIDGVVLTFDRSGILSWHTHDIYSAHISIVGRGSFVMRTAPYEKGPVEERIIKSGALVDTPAGVWHEFEALESDSRLFQLIKGVKA